MTTEQLVRDALHAKAAEVRPEQVDMPFPAPPRARRPVRAGLAVVVAAAVAAVVITTWAIAARSAGIRQQSAVGSGGTATASAAGRIVSPPFQVPVGWTGVTAAITDQYTSWCVTDSAAGADRCPGVTVYLAAAGRTVPPETALLPACDSATTTQQRPTVVDRRAASMFTRQCTPTEPTWVAWRTADGTFAVVAEKDGPAYTTAAEILSGVHLPGAPPPAAGTVSSAPPVPSTSTCPPGLWGRFGMATNAGVAGSTAPVPSTDSRRAGDGCPAG